MSLRRRALALLTGPTPIPPAPAFGSAAAGASAPAPQPVSPKFVLLPTRVATLQEPSIMATKNSDLLAAAVQSAAADDTQGTAVLTCQAALDAAVLTKAGTATKRAADAGQFAVAIVQQGGEIIDPTVNPPISYQSSDGKTYTRTARPSISDDAPPAPADPAAPVGSAPPPPAIPLSPPTLPAPVTPPSTVAPVGPPVEADPTSPATPQPPPTPPAASGAGDPIAPAVPVAADPTTPTLDASSSVPVPLPTS